MTPRHISPHSSPHFSRRGIARAAISLPALGLGLAGLALLPSTWALPGLHPTPAQTEGPFYPVELPRDADFDLLRNGDLVYRNGHPAWVQGTVVDLDGRPVRGAQVEIWQCDEDGHYHHPRDRGEAAAAFQGFGKTMVDAKGQYRFHTIRPAPYSGRTPHIHFKVRLGQRELLTTQLYVADEPRNARDFLWRNMGGDEDRAAVTRAFTPGPDGFTADFPIVVAA